MRRADVERWEGVSDLSLEWHERPVDLYERAVRRYEALGSPGARVLVWLDEHNVYPKRADLDTRVRALPHEGLISLLQVLEDWRVEAVPSGAEGELEGQGDEPE